MSKGYVTQIEIYDDEEARLEARVFAFGGVAEVNIIEVVHDTESWRKLARAVLRAIEKVTGPETPV